MPRAERERDGAAPVVADAVPSIEPEMPGEQPEDIVRHRPLVVAFEWPRRVAEAAHVERDHRVMRREPWHHVAPLVPGFRPAVHEHERRHVAEAGAGRDVMNRHLTEIGEVMLEIVSAHRLRALPGMGIY